MAAELASGEPAAVLPLAQAYFAAGRYDKAARTLQAALSVNPHWPEVEWDVREMYGDPDDLVRQMGALARRIQTNPLDGDAVFLLAFELFVSGEVERSRRLFEQAAKLCPDHRHIQPYLDYLGRLDDSQPATNLDENAGDGGVPFPSLLLVGAEGASRSPP